MGLIVSLETAITTAIDTFVSTKSAALCAALTPIALTATTIYIMSMGYAIARGEIQDSVNDFTKRVLRLSIIMAIALGGGVYQSYVIDFVQGVQGAFIQVFSGGAATTLGQLIETSTDPLVELSSAIFTRAISASTWGIPDLTLLIEGLIVILAQIVICLVGLGMYLIAIVGLGLSLAVGPAFILCAAFPATKRFTESWAGVALGFAITNAMIAACLSMFGSIVQQYAQKVLVTIDDPGATLEATVMLLILTAVISLVLWNIKTLATALTGGVAIEGIGSAIAHKLMHSSGGGKGGSEPNKPSGGEVGSGGGSSGGSSGSGGGSGSRSGSNSRGGGGGGRRPMYQRHVFDNLNKS